MKLKYNQPKIYTGGVDFQQWSKLKSSEKKEALAKDWYLYYSAKNERSIPSAADKIEHSFIIGN